MSSLISAEITATCNALGYNDGLRYQLDPYCKESVKDLIRYLRRDDENHEIRRQLGTSQVVQTDLIPIISQHSADEEIFDLTLRLLVNLMSPVILLYREELPAEKVSRNYYLQILTQLQTAKAAFTDEKIWKVLAEKLSSILKLEWADRGEEKGLILERILILARNVLHVPADASTEKRPDNDASVHDQVLWAMHTSGLIDLFLYLASSDNETQYYLHILEIVSLMLREQTPKLLANVSVTRSTEEKVQDNAALLNVRQKEIEEKAEKMRKYAGARHSRFGGTFVVKGVKSIGERDMVLLKAPKEINQLTFDQHKVKVKTPKNRLPLRDSQESRKSAYSVRLFLKEFCVEFLNGAYNPFMFSVREKISRGKAQPNDESYYFWALAFFMEFNRLYKFQIKLVSETMAVQIFHLAQSQLESWFENMVIDKKKIPIWSKRMHLALKAYKELLLTLAEMDRSPDESVRASSKTVKGNLYYVPDYRDLVFTLFSHYTPMKFTRSYLTDLVETVHIFLKSLEHFCKTTHNMVVMKKSSGRGGKKKKKSKKKAAAKKAPARDLEMIWEMIGSEVSALLQNEELIPTNVVPFDAASDMSMGEQKVEAMKKIRSQLKNGDVEQAIGLLRAAREVWPENDCFGGAEMDPSDELLAVREIFMTDIGELTVDDGGDSDGSDDESSDGEREESGLNVGEQSFTFFDFLKRFAKPSIIQACCYLLDQFEKNSETTNHYIVKFLHRICVDCKLPSMIFQASVFRTFQRILISKNPSHKELQKFAVFIIRKFVEVANKNKNVFMELLFWKNSKEAYEIEEGYGQSESKPSGAMNRIWTEDQEQELRVLFEEYERDKPESDMVDWIMKNLINKERKKANVVKKLKELGLKKTKAPKEPKPRKSKPKSKHQKSHQEMFDGDSDRSGSESDGPARRSDNSESDAESTSSENSQEGRLPFKSQPLSMNTDEGSGARNYLDSSDSDEGNMDSTLRSTHKTSRGNDSISAAATSSRNLNDDDDSNHHDNDNETFTPSQESNKSGQDDEESFLRSLSSHPTQISSQKSRKSDGDDEESFLRSLSSHPTQISSQGSNKSEEDDEAAFLRSLSSNPTQENSQRSKKSDEEDEESFLRSLSSNPSSHPTASNSKERSRKVLSSDSSDDDNSGFSSLLSSDSKIPKSKRPSIKKRPSKTVSLKKSEPDGGKKSSAEKRPAKTVSVDLTAKKSSAKKGPTKTISIDSSDDEDGIKLSAVRLPSKAISVDSSDEEDGSKLSAIKSSSKIISLDSSDEEDGRKLLVKKRPSNTISLDSSDEEDAEKQPTKKRPSKTISLDSSDEEDSNVIGSKTPLQLISNSKDFISDENHRSTISSDEEHTLQSNSTQRQSLPRKRLRKAVSSDEENVDLVSQVSPSGSQPNSSSKRSRKASNSDDENFDIARSKVFSKASSDLDVNAIDKNMEEKDGTNNKNSTTPRSKMSSHFDSDSTMTPSRENLLPLNSSSNDTPAKKMSLHLKSPLNVTPSRKTLDSDSIDTPGSIMSLHLASDSEVTPSRKASHSLDSDSNGTPGDKMSLRFDSDLDVTPIRKPSHPPTSDSKDTPGGNMSLHLDSDSNDSPAVAKRASISSQSRNRKLIMDSDTD